MAVGAIVLLTIQTVFFGALRLRNTANDRIEAELSLHRALELVKRDLAGTMLPGGVLVPDFRTAAVSSMDTAVSGERIGEFLTDTGRIDARTPFADTQRVAYYLSPETASGRFDLVRSVSRNLLATTEDIPETQTLLTGIRDATFQYYDGRDWIDTWDSAATSTLPTAIRFRIQFPGGSNGGPEPAPIDVVVPISVTMAAAG